MASLLPNFQATDVSGMLYNAVYWISLISVVLLLMALAFGALYFLKNKLRYNVKVFIFRKGQNGWQLIPDRGGIVKEKDKLGEKKEKFKFLKLRISLPPFRSDDFIYSQGVFTINKHLFLEHLGQMDYRPMTIQQHSEAALTSRLDYDVYNWLINELRNDANTWLKDEGFGAFLRTYWPVIGLTMIIVALFVFKMIELGAYKDVAGSFSNAAHELAQASSRNIPQGP